MLCNLIHFNDVISCIQSNGWNECSQELTVMHICKGSCLVGPIFPSYCFLLLTTLVKVPAFNVKMDCIPIFCEHMSSFQKIVFLGALKILVHNVLFVWHYQWTSNWFSASQQYSYSKENLFFQLLCWFAELYLSCWWF